MTVDLRNLEYPASLYELKRALFELEPQTSISVVIGPCPFEEGNRNLVLRYCERKRYVAQSVDTHLISVKKTHGAERERLKLEGVSYSLEDGSELFSDLNLMVKAGEIVAIMGPSGTGKSTLLALIAGLLKPSRGVVKLNNQHLKAASSSICLVPQNCDLFPWLTVQQNVEFGLKLNGIPPKVREEMALSFLKKIGMHALRDRPIQSLSGGQARKVALARALVLDPAVVLLDEPLTGLDFLSRSNLIEEIQQLWAESSKTMIIITHHAEEAFALADRIVFLNGSPAMVVEETVVDFQRPRRLGSTEVISKSKNFLSRLQAER